MNCCNSDTDCKGSYCMKGTFVWNVEEVWKRRDCVEEVVNEGRGVRRRREMEAAEMAVIAAPARVATVWRCRISVNANP